MEQYKAIGDNQIIVGGKKFVGNDASFLAVVGTLSETALKVSGGDQAKYDALLIAWIGGMAKTLDTCEAVRTNAALDKLVELANGDKIVLAKLAEYRELRGVFAQSTVELVKSAGASRIEPVGQPDSHTFGFITNDAETFGKIPEMYAGQKIEATFNPEYKTWRIVIKDDELASKFAPIKVNKQEIAGRINVIVGENKLDLKTVNLVPSADGTRVEPKKDSSGKTGTGSPRGTLVGKNDRFTYTFKKSGWTMTGTSEELFEPAVKEFTRLTGKTPAEYYSWWNTGQGKAGHSRARKLSGMSYEKVIEG